MLIPNKHCGFRADGTRLACIDGGGGGGSTTSTGTTYTSPVPEWLKSEQKEIVARGLALSDQPYQPYTGERVSQFTPLQRQAYGAAEGQQVAGQLGLATGLAGLSGLQSFRDPGTAGSFMNPFLEQALAPQLQGLARQSQIEGTRQQGEATMRGAFGGSRDAIMRAEREKNLLGQQSDVLGRGYAQAFDTAQSQFNAERAAQMQAAGLLGDLGQQQFGQEMGIMGRQREFGADQQKQIQRILDQQYADFQAQKDFPYQQVGFASDIIQGRGGSTRQMYAPAQPSGLQTIAGLGTAAAGIGGMFATGGEVQGYANGGITGLLDDQQLAQAAQNPGQGPMMQLAAAEEAQQRDMIRSAAPADMPHETDMTEQELVAALQQAIREGNQTKARVIAELIEERKMPESGIAAIASDDIGDMPEGGLIGMAMGGEVQRFYGGGMPISPMDLTEEEFQQRLLEEQEMQSGRGLMAAPTAEQMAAAHQANPRMMAGLPALKQIDDTPPADGSVSSGGVMAPAELMAMAREFGIDPQAAAERQTKLAGQQAEARERGLTEREANLEAFIQSRGVYGKDQEAEARQEIEGLAGKKLDAKNFALIQAGLAILSADPSRGAFSAIGEGAAKGLMGYKGDLEKLDEKREKINGRLDRILELRRLETTADGKDRLSLKNERSKLEELALEDTQEIMGNLDKSEQGLGTVLLNASLKQRSDQLDRDARAANLRNRSAGDLAQLRISLDGEIARLERKDFRTDEEEARLAKAVTERDEVRRLLGERSGMGSAGGTGGGTLSSADQDLINKYR
jgi:hypothetical protein